MNLRTLSDSEFLRYANSQMDDLTSSDVERELLRRLEAIDTDTFEAATELGFTGDDLRNLNEAHAELSTKEVVELLDAASSTNISQIELILILKVLNDADITEADELKESLEFAAKFQAIANDAGDVFTRLTTLITDTQED